MTQEQKAKAYDEALKAAVVAYKDDDRHLKATLERIFHELRESDDERIRKALIFHYQGDGCLCTNEYRIDYKEIRAWLEKQGRDKEINNFDVFPGLYKCVHRMFDGTPDGKLLFEVGNVYRCLSKHDRAEFEVSYGHSVYLEDPVVCKHFIPFEKRCEQNPDDKIEPKFKVGDWVVYNDNGCICQIKSIREDDYCLWPLDGDVEGYLRIIDVDTEYHLWTIADAKCGDVLVCESGWTCIFKTLVNDETFSSYCFMDRTKWFCETGSECHTLKEEFVKAYNGKIYPATKEQRDTFEKVMADAGWEFDFDKKELSKIEQKPAEWSVEDKLMLMSCIEIMQTVDSTEEQQKWLKSLRPQNRWKPSEIQKGCIEQIIDGEPYNRDVLIGLFSDLKKL